MQASWNALKGSALLGAALAMSACGSSSSNSSLGDQPTITGQIDGWNRGTGFTLQAQVGDAMKPAASAGLSGPLATAPIDAMGNFSITLPGAAALTPYLAPLHTDPSQPLPGCTANNLQVDPQDIMTRGLWLYAVSGTTQLFIKQTVQTTIAAYIYVDRDFNETGSAACPITVNGMVKGQIQETYDLHYGTGWNIETVNLTTSAYTFASGMVPAGAKWTIQ
jgi:hypothetical protein